MNEDTEYELLTMRIYQLLLNNEGFNTIQVQHNVSLEGKSSVKHQIDVFWEFQIAGVIHKVAIECKNYNSSITLGRVRDFHSVLQDIGNLSGIMVTKKGYQSGVQDYARHHKIGLKILRNPIEEDWNGRLKKIEIQINIVLPEILSREIVLDEDWIKTNKQITEQNISYSISGLSNEIWILDNKKEKYRNFQELDTKLPINTKEDTNIEYTYDFEDNYIEIEKMGLLKVKGIKYKYNILKGEGANLVIDAAEIVDKILKDVLSGDIKFIHKDGDVR